MTRIDIALAIVIAVNVIVFIIALWKIDERVLRLEAIVRCMEKEAMHRKIAAMREEGADNAHQSKQNPHD